MSKHKISPCVNDAMVENNTIYLEFLNKIIMTQEQEEFKKILEKHCIENKSYFSSNEFHTIWNALQEYNYGWIKYDFNDLSTRPPKPDRYFVMRKDGKVHWETWNGQGWAYNNNVITHWKQIKLPK